MASNVNLLNICFHLFFSQLDNFFHNFNFIVYFVLNYFDYRIYQLSSKESVIFYLKRLQTINIFVTKYDENNDPIGHIHKNIFSSLHDFQPFVSSRICHYYM